MTTKDEVKLGDFGFARILNTNELLTDYVATRWYRSVELLVGDLQYGSPTDIWGLGCVMAEMTNGEPLYVYNQCIKTPFRWPGRTDLDQLFLIKQTMGDILSRHVQIFRSNQFFRGMTIPEPQERVDLRQKLPQASPITIDFLLVITHLLNLDYLRLEMLRSQSRTSIFCIRTTSTRILPKISISIPRREYNSPQEIYNDIPSSSTGD